MKCRAGWCTSWNELCAGIVCLVAQLCLTLCNPWSGAHQAFCPWGFSRQEYWSGLPCPPSGDLPNPGIEPRFPALQAESLPSEQPGNEDFWEKYQQPLICRWYYPNGRKQRGTKDTFDESERGEQKPGLKLSIQKTKIMASGPITSWQIDGETVETVADFVFLGSKFTSDIDCGHEIKRRLGLGSKPVASLDSVLKCRDITLLTKIHVVKAMIFPSVMYACESWTIKKAEGWRIDAFKLCCWRVPWTARSN